MIIGNTIHQKKVFQFQTNFKNGLDNLVSDSITDIAAKSVGRNLAFIVWYNLMRNLKYKK
jgi:hypothetical protein